MPSHSEGPGIWLSVWRFLLTHCLYERAAEVLARLRGWYLGDKYQIRLTRPCCNFLFAGKASFYTFNIVPMEKKWHGAKLILTSLYTSTSVLAATFMTECPEYLNINIFSKVWNSVLVFFHKTIASCKRKIDLWEDKTYKMNGIISHN